MRIAYRYIFRELLGPLLFGVAAFVTILAAGGPLMELTKLAFQGVAGLDILTLFALSLPAFVVLTLPMSMLLAALLGFGRLSGDSEMVAMYASGMSLYRAAVPVVLLAALMTGLTIFLNEAVVPRSIEAANRLEDRLKAQVREQKQLELRLPQYNGRSEEVGIVRAQTFDPRTGEMGKITVQYFLRGVPVRVLYAESATRSSEYHWTLRNGWYRDLRPDSTAPAGSFTAWDLRIQQTLGEMEDQSRKPREMSLAQLQRHLGLLHRQGRYSETPPYEVAWWNRFALPFACVVFALVGMPLGLRPHRTSGGLGLGMSIVIIFIYWVVWEYTGNMGAQGRLPPFVASWLANGLGLGVGLALLARAPK